MRCTPKKTVEQIVKSENHDCIGLKGNQKTLLHAAQHLSQVEPPLSEFQEQDSTHGLTVPSDGARLCCSCVTLATLVWTRSHRCGATSGSPRGARLPSPLLVYPQPGHSSRASCRVDSQPSRQHRKQAALGQGCGARRRRFSHSSGEPSDAFGTAALLGDFCLSQCRL